MLATRFSDRLQADVFARRESILQKAEGLLEAVNTEVGRTRERLDAARNEKRSLENTIDDLHGQHGAALRHEEWERQQAATGG